MSARLLGAALALAALAGCGGRESAHARFHSRPDLTPPIVQVAVALSAAAPGYVFLAPKREVPQTGPLIVDDHGQAVWFEGLDAGGVADFRVQRYQGRPVLTWWRGRAPKGVGSGYDVIADASYREIARVRAGNGLAADIHEFLITPDDTALITVYRRVGRDLRPFDGVRNGVVLEGVVQEIDIATGRVLFEWHSLGRVGLRESYTPVPKSSAPWDYFHVNSIDVEPDGNLLVSARNTHAVYEIDRQTRQVLWRLGGKRSDFVLGPNARFAWQHDGRRHADGTISIFDNEADPPYRKQTRVLVLRLDEAARTANLVRSYTHPSGLLSGSQGDAQFLPNGNVLVGWGSNPNVTEFTHGGRVVFDASFAQGADSYRAYRFPWHGRPAEPPALALESDRRGRVTAYASWNGATGVTVWRVVAGPDEEHLRRIAAVSKRGFETAIPLGLVHERYLAVQALAADGAVLGASEPQPRPAR